MRAKGGSFPSGRTCAAAGCALPGDYRAPLAPPSGAFAPGPPQWQYLCLDHVRAFNAGWNYFEGLEGEALWQAQQRPYARWEAEARGFAARRGAAGPAPSARACPLSGDDRDALARLGLGPGASMAEVKARYRALARRYHPDANQGRRDHESRLQALNAAYTHLKQSPAFKSS